ncbi:MAG: LamG domain-containing protein [Nitrososphaera sp.]|nr:LamG domain-containing protein [Nitrososphaera sp.]
MLRRFLILTTLLLSISLLSFGTDLGSSFGAFLQSITPRKGSAPLSYTLENGLVGHWTFDGKDTAWNSNTTQDKSGQGNTGTMTSMSTTTSPAPGKLGQGFNFDGVDDNITIANTISGIQSVGFWMLGTTTPSAKIIDLDGGTNSIESVNGTITVTGFGTETVYVDGVVSYTITGGWHYVTVTTASALSGNAIKIGTIGTGFFTGTLDDVRIYNRALSADEVKQLYLQGSSLKQSITPRKGSAPLSYTLENGLVGHWTFDGKDTAWNSNTTQDKSGQGNTGTITNMSTTTSPVPGKLGQGMQFDGVNDMINGASASSLDNIGNGTNGDGLTVSAWIFPSTLPPATRMIVANKASNSAGDDGWSFGKSISDTKKLFFGVDYSGASDLLVVTTDNAISENTWQHVLVVWDGSPTASNVHIYVNNQEKSYVTQVSGVSSRVDDSTIDLVVGSRITGVDIFNGSLDDVRIYNRALSADEIKQLYLMGR